MITLKGTPAAQIGTSSRDCSGDDLIVPAPCSSCRQVTRWAEKALSWAKTSNSRMQAMVRAVLQADDDILAALCGYCAVQPTLTCECLMSEYRATGLPTSIEVRDGDHCIAVTREVRLKGCAAGECWLEECVDPCAKCAVETLDPCASVDHLQLVRTAIAVKKAVYGKRPTAPTLMAALSAAFPGSSPALVLDEVGRVSVTIGRPMTPTEWRYLPFLTRLLPVPFGTDIRFLLPCENAS